MTDKPAQTSKLGFFFEVDEVNEVNEVDDGNKSKVMKCHIMIIPSGYR
jgi:hypothetical protein